MKKFFRIVFEIILAALFGVKMVIENNMRNLATFLNVLLPFGMYFIGQEVALARGNIAAGGELFIPLIVGFVVYFIRQFSNRIGKGITVPVPTKRFTECSEDGEVNVRNSRLQEMILYLADLEDWLERKGLL